MVVTKVVPIASLVPQRDISWCFKPLFMWMRILGIELDPACNPRKKIIYFYGLLLFLACQWGSITVTANSNALQFSQPINVQSRNSTGLKSAMYDWNVRITMINHFSFVSIVSPAFYYVAHNRRWLRLLDVMKTFHFVYCKFNRDAGKIHNFLFVVGFVPIITVRRFYCCSAKFEFVLFTLKFVLLLYKGNRNND